MLSPRVKKSLAFGLPILGLCMTGAMVESSEPEVDALTEKEVAALRMAFDQAPMHAAMALMPEAFVNTDAYTRAEMERVREAFDAYLPDD